MPIHDAEAILERSRLPTGDRRKSNNHLDHDGAENTDSSTNPPGRAEKSEMEEIRLELELMKKQMRALMSQTDLSTSSPVAGTPGGGLSGSMGRGTAKPEEVTGVGHLPQQYIGPPVVTTGSAGGSFGPALVKSLIPLVPFTQTPRDGEMERLKGELKKRNADLENYQRELKSLQHDMKSHVTSINTLQADRAKLTDANSCMHQELLSVKKELEEIKTEADMQTEKLKGDLKKRNADLENYQRELKRLQRDVRSHVTSINILQADRAKLTDANNSMHYELIHVKKQLEEIRTLADGRGKELLDSQKFLTKADSISISDLKEKVVALNDEIFQAAAFLGETITHHPHKMTSEDANRVYGEVLQLIGEPIGNLLVDEGRKPNADPNPLLVQVALQVFLTTVCASKIELWVPNDPNISDFFASVYTDIQSAEEPAVSGRWRALTQRHTRPITQGWKEGLISSLMRIMKIAAWKMPDKEQRLSFEGKLVPIFEAVEDLRIAMGEKITSANIRVSLVPPLSQFHASWMEDAFADARAKTAPYGPVQCVVGTTRFGLKKDLATVQRGPSGELLYESVLSPKVILESTLRDALKPLDSVMCGKT